MDENSDDFGLLRSPVIQKKKSAKKKYTFIIARVDYYLIFVSDSIPGDIMFSELGHPVVRRPRTSTVDVVLSGQGVPSSKVDLKSDQGNLQEYESNLQFLNRSDNRVVRLSSRISNLHSQQSSLVIIEDFQSAHALAYLARYRQKPIIPLAFPLLEASTNHTP